MGLVQDDDVTTLGRRRGRGEPRTTARRHRPMNCTPGRRTAGDAQRAFDLYGDAVTFDPTAADKALVKRIATALGS